MAELSVTERIARIEEECASTLGFAMRGVSSWDREWLASRRSCQDLPYYELVRLVEIEVQVFGESPSLNG